MSETEHEHEHDDDDDPQTPQEPVSDDGAELEAEESEAEEVGASGSEEPPQADAALQEIWDKRWQTADRAAKAYFKKIEDAWGDDAVKLTRFMLGPNAPYGYISSDDVGRVPAELKEGLELYLGHVREQDYEPDPNAAQCATCKGKGFTALPSLVGGNDKRTCPTCNGAGWLEQAAAAPGSAGNGYAPPALVAPLTPDIQHGETDEWGEPRILPDGRANPNYGKLPQHKVTVEPFGITRLLTQAG